MSTPLNKPAVSELALETSTLDLFAEFLKRFFDGAAHTVGLSTGVIFPAATLGFQQTAPPQPLKGVSIAMVWNSPTQVRKAWEGNGGSTQEVATTPARWMFFIRCELTDKGDAKAMCMEAAQKLFGLLGNSAATLPLAQKGIHRVKPSTPALVTDTGYVLRQMPCTAQLRWPVRSQPA